jgi:hypothetical protein
MRQTSSSEAPVASFIISMTFLGATDFAMLPVFLLIRTNFYVSMGRGDRGQQQVAGDHYQSLLLLQKLTSCTPFPFGRGLQACLRVLEVKLA